MPTTKQEISICLFELPDKDQAVIQRVITFGASQGKPYALHANLGDAHIVVASDDTPLPTHSAVSIRIGDAGSAGCDLILARPLLVTRVMRMLDDAATLSKSRPAATIPTPVVEEHIPQSPPETITQAISTPEPISEPEIIPPIAEAVVEAEQVVEQAKTETEVSEPITLANNATPEAICEDVVTEAETADSYLYLALVVDDSAAIRKQLEIELRNAQIKAEFAETGEEALEKSQSKLYDLVFLDIIMPGIDGYEVCRQMRSRKNMKKTPIIMLSGKTSPLDEVQGVIAGASTYLTKPVKHEQFQQTLKRVSKWLTNFAR
jgi:CheY-like chemotaxis protein